MGQPARQVSRQAKQEAGTTLRLIDQFSPGNLDEVVAYFTEVLESHPEDAKAYYARGVAHMRKGRYQRRWDYLGRGDLDKAIADFTHAIRLGHKAPDVFLRRGATHQANGDLNKAVADFTQLIELTPKEPTAYLRRARVYELKGQRDEAKADRDIGRELASLHGVESAETASGRECRLVGQNK